MKLDGYGISGLFFNAALCLIYFFGALAIFIHLWRKKRLDLDEEPKHQMLNKENPDE